MVQAMDALSPPTMGPGEMVSDDMVVEIHDLTSPRVDFGDFRNHGFSRADAATAAAIRSALMESVLSASPLSTGASEVVSGGAAGSHSVAATTASASTINVSEHAMVPPTSGASETISSVANIPTLDLISASTATGVLRGSSLSIATTAAMTADASTSKASVVAPSRPPTGSVAMVPGATEADTHDSGSPQTANRDFPPTRTSSGANGQTIDSRHPVPPPATSPSRLEAPGLTATAHPRVEPRSRESAYAVTATSPPPTSDPWTAFAAKRVEATKASRTKDVGTYRPSMVDLEPLLAKHAAGTLSFHDTLPIQKHDKREVVGWLHMATGNHTKAINEDAAMASLLHDNQSLVKGDTLVDVIKCEKDLQNRMLRWGVASDTALRQLQGTTLKLRITTTSGKVKSTTLVSFQLTLPHALDGFYMDIPAGLQCLFEERLLFETLHRLEPRFLWGMYTSVSATTGLAGSRYRLHFLGSEIPSTMLLDGRMVEEFIFRGRCVRVYGRGWFFRDKRLARLDLDSITASKAPVIPSTPPPPPTTAPQATPAKRQKTTTKDPSEWTEVRRKTPSVQPAPYRVHTHGRPWTSPNAFAALHERWHVGHAVHQATHDGVVFESIIPELHTLDNDHAHLTTDEYVTCPKPTKGKVSHLEVPVDELLSELQSLEGKSIAAVQHLASHVEDAVRGSAFNLANLVDSGRVDSICTMMARHPEDFGIQLHHLFAADRPTFELLIRQ
ncbi:hypothetical protein DYB31_009960, partial [Aphanomyces astaci]